MRLGLTRLCVDVVYKTPVATFVRQQTGWAGNYVVAFQPRDVIKPDATRDQSFDVRCVQLCRVIAPAWKVAVLRRLQFGVDAVDVEAPRTVPPGNVLVATARCPLLHSCLVSEHLPVYLCRQKGLPICSINKNSVF